MKHSCFKVIHLYYSCNLEKAYKIQKKERTQKKLLFAIENMFLDIDANLEKTLEYYDEIKSRYSDMELPDIKDCCGEFTKKEYTNKVIKILAKLLKQIHTDLHQLKKHQHKIKYIFIGSVPKYIHTLLKETETSRKVSTTLNKFFTYDTTKEWGNLSTSCFTKILFVTQSIHKYEKIQDIKEKIEFISDVKTPISAQSYYWLENSKYQITHKTNEIYKQSKIDDNEKNEYIFVKLEKYMNNMGYSEDTINNIQKNIVLYKENYSFSNFINQYINTNELYGDLYTISLSNNWINKEHKTIGVNNPYIFINFKESNKKEPIRNYFTLNSLNQTTLNDLCDINDNTLYVMDLKSVTDVFTRDISFNNLYNKELIDNFFVYYFPKLTTKEKIKKEYDKSTEKNKVNTFKLEYETQLNTYKNIIDDNSQKFDISESNIMLLDLVSTPLYTKGSMIDLQFIFNNVKLNTFRYSKNNNYNTPFVKFFDKFTGKVIYKIDTIFWNKLETTEQINIKLSRNTKEHLLKLLKYDNVQYTGNTYKPVESKFKHLQYKLYISRIITNYDNKLTGIIQDIDEVKNIYSVRVNNVDTLITKECIIGKHYGDRLIEPLKINVQDKIDFVDYMDTMPFFVTIDLYENRKARCLLFSNKEHVIDKNKITQIMDISNDFLKEINKMLLSNNQNTFELFSEKTDQYNTYGTKLKSMSVQKLINIPCFTKNCDSGFSLSLSNMRILEQIIPYFYPHFELKNSLSIGNEVHFKHFSQVFIGKIKNINGDLYDIENKEKKVFKKIKKEQIITDNVENLFQLDLIYKNKSYFSNLSIIKKDIKFLKERDVPRNTMELKIAKKYSLTTKEASAIIDEFLFVNSKFKIQNGVNVTIDLSSIVNRNTDNFGNFNIYIHDITNSQQINDICTLIQNIFTTYVSFYFSKDKLTKAKFEYDESYWPEYVEDDPKFEEMDEDDIPDSSKFYDYYPNDDSEEDAYDFKENYMTFSETFKYFDEKIEEEEDSVENDEDFFFMNTENNEEEMNDEDYDNYETLLKNIESLKERDNKLFKLKSYESEFEKNKIWKRKCQKSRYPTLLTRREFKKILARDEKTNDELKQLIIKSNAEIQYNINEEVFIKNTNTIELVKVIDMENQVLKCVKKKGAKKSTTFQFQEVFKKIEIGNNVIDNNGTEYKILDIKNNIYIAKSHERVLEKEFKRNEIYKFIKINSLSIPGFENAQDCNTDDIDNMDVNTKCRSIVYNNNYYICPKMVDVNQWFSIDQNDPKFIYTYDPYSNEENKINRRFVSKSIDKKSKIWFKDKKGKNIRDFKPIYKDTNQVYKPIAKGDIRSGENTIIISEYDYHYPGLMSINNTNIKLPCCFETEKNVFDKDMIQQSNKYVSSWNKNIKVNRLGALHYKFKNIFTENNDKSGNIANNFYRLNTSEEKNNSFFSTFYKAFHVNKEDIFSNKDMELLVSHNKFTNTLFNLLNKGTLPMYFKTYHPHISPFQKYIEYLLSDTTKTPKFVYDLLSQPMSVVDDLFVDTFNIPKTMKNHMIVLFDLVKGNMVIYEKLLQFFDKYDNKYATKEYIQTLIETKKIKNINQELLAKYNQSPNLRKKDNLETNYDVKIVCPKNLSFESFESLKKKKMIFFLKQNDKYELIVYNKYKNKKELVSVFDSLKENTTKFKSKQTKNKNFHEYMMNIQHKILEIYKNCSIINDTNKNLLLDKNIQERLSKKQKHFNHTIYKTVDKQSKQIKCFLKDNYNHIVAVQFKDNLILPILPVNIYTGKYYTKLLKLKQNCTHIQRILKSDIPDTDTQIQFLKSKNIFVKMISVSTKTMGIITINNQMIPTRGETKKYTNIPTVEMNLFKIDNYLHHIYGGVLDKTYNHNELLIELEKAIHKRNTLRYVFYYDEQKFVKGYAIKDINDKSIALKINLLNMIKKEELQKKLSNFIYLTEKVSFLESTKLVNNKTAFDMFNNIMFIYNKLKGNLLIKPESFLVEKKEGKLVLRGYILETNNIVECKDSDFLEVFREFKKDMFVFDPIKNFKITKDGITEKKDKRINTMEKIIFEKKIYELFLKEVAYYLEQVNYNKKINNEHYILYKKRDSVLFQKNGLWLSGVIKDINKDLAIIETKNTAEEVKLSKLFLTLKDGILNILNRRLISKVKKREYLHDLIEKSNILKDIIKIDDTLKFNEHYISEKPCGYHKNKHKCHLYEICNFSSSLSLFDTFRKQEIEKLNIFIKIRLLQEYFDNYNSEWGVIEMYLDKIDNKLTKKIKTMYNINEYIKNEKIIEKIMLDHDKFAKKKIFSFKKIKNTLGIKNMYIKQKKYTEDYIILESKNSDILDFQRYVTEKFNILTKNEKERISKNTSDKKHKCKLTLNQPLLHKFKIELVESLLNNTIIKQKILNNTFSLYKNKDTFSVNKNEQLFTSETIQNLIYENILFNSKKMLMYNFNFFDTDAIENRRLDYIMEDTEEPELKDLTINGKLVKNIEVLSSMIKTYSYKKVSSTKKITMDPISDDDKNKIEQYNKVKSNKNFQGILKKQTKKYKYKFINV